MDFKAINIGKDRYIVHMPNNCHYCDKGIVPKIINKFKYQYYNMTNIIVTYQCPSCSQVFFSKYQVDFLGNELYPFETIGGHKIPQKFDSLINEISPMFVTIFNEALIAEQDGCTNIVGMGYRKAFEFLMKDFAIKYNPDDKDEIASTTLSQCVTKYIPDGETKELLLRASWIGNDYTHYYNKHEEVTLDDFKQLIMLSVNSIESFIKRKSYISKIEKK